MKSWLQYLREMHPFTGRFIASDGSLINMADFIQKHPLNNARGLFAGGGALQSYGERATIGAETNYPIWPDGGYRIPPIGGCQMSIVSTSANDSGAGTNIRTLELHYLDINLNDQVEIITLNGQLPVLTQATDIRFIQCMHVSTFGTIYNAAGDITASFAGDIYSHISAGETRCTSSFRMVPAGKKLFITGLMGSSISGTAAARTTMHFVASALDNHQYTYPLILIPQAAIGMQDSSEVFALPPMPGYSAGTVVGFTHTTDKAAILSGSIFGRLEPV